VDREEVNESRLPQFGRSALVAFVCECEDESCRQTVPLISDEYAAMRESGNAVLFPGHVPIADAPLAAEAAEAPTTTHIQVYSPSNAG
jgi:hypothetical protein